MRPWVLAVVLAAACSQPQPPLPYAGDPYAAPRRMAGTGEDYHCTALSSSVATGTLCFATYDRCEGERQRAEADGARAEACRQQAPVACFQLRGDPNPSMEMCSASTQDCELFRRIDHDKNGQTGAACDWRHGPGLPP